MHLDEFWKSLATYNAPQIIAALVVVAIVALMLAVRHLSAPGTAKLAAEQSERSAALDVLQSMIARQDERIESLEAQAAKDARYDQDYRHALGNRVQAFMLCYDAAHELLTRIADKWKEMPGDLKAEIRALPKAVEVDQRNPLPKREVRN